ncbi:DUF924 family protein [Amaricoccus macauensis]|uniref:DUF924 family protein n=1 Tax=Amaricoccus macauensis TaxID=57001 RepID=UPI003C7C371C
MDKRAEQILTFWFDEIGTDAWYNASPELDATILQKFEQIWGFAARGELDQWICEPLTSLALLVLLDQFPRNMFRGDRKAFATDAKALRAAKEAISIGHDQRLEMPGRQFFYLPFMHSEIGPDQERAVRLFMFSEAETGLLHARAHRWVIRKFGRFPYRNEAFGRKNTPEEEAFLANGGYELALKEVRDT